MIKRIIFMSLAIMVIVLGTMFILKSFNEDEWLCINGQWIQHGNPSMPKPSFGCAFENKATTTEDNISTTTDENTAETDIKVASPLPDSEISNPLVVNGEARGSWFFEGSFPIRLKDDSGNILATGVAQAQSEWTTDNFVPFTASLQFSTTTATSGELVLAKDNPSGLPENAKFVIIPLKFAASESLTVKVFFSNDKLDPSVACDKVFPVDRVIPKTEAVAKAAVEELLKGPTDQEKASGYNTQINTGVTINSLNLDQGTLKVDFDENMEKNLGGSCRVTAIRAQIMETLKQFSSVYDVVISVNGKTEGILQP